MNTLDKKYQELLQDILDNGIKKSDRTGTGTISVFGRQIRHKMSDGFPLLTTKKMYTKGVITELVWFLRGDTNIKYLVDNDCHIWNGDAYKNYVNKQTTEDVGSMDWFIEQIKTDEEFAKKWGELGPVYGRQWRGWGAPYGHMMWSHGIDQIANLINDLKTNPDSRRLMVTAWNPADLESSVLPPCHYGFQVYTRELSEKERLQILLPDVQEQADALMAFSLSLLMKKADEQNIPTRAISLMWNQRSVDTFLGLPFNIASYGLLLEIIAKEVNMVPDQLIGSLGDVHLYLDHIEQAKEQIGRELTTEERNEWHLVNRCSGNKRDCKTDWNDFELDQQDVPTRTREPYPLPKIMICGDMRRTDGFTVPFDELDHSLIKLIDYQSHPTIKAPLSN